MQAENGGETIGLYSRLSPFLEKTKQLGAAEARRAHNPEVPRSKRGVAN